MRDYRGPIYGVLQNGPLDGKPGVLQGFAGLGCDGIWRYVVEDGNEGGEK